MILAVFWFRFGALNAFAFGFTVFLTALQILIIVGRRFAGRKRLRAPVKLKNDRKDRLGAWWLVACAFGALFGWIAARLADGFPQFEVYLLAAAVVLTIALPVATVPPLLRHLDARLAYVRVPILFFVTVRPVLVGLSPLFRLWRIFSARP